jgi:hypothetical protein
MGILSIVMTPSLTNQQPENKKPDAEKKKNLLEAKFPKSGTISK